VPFQASAITAPTMPVSALMTDEDLRAQKDPDYRWLVSDIAAIDTVREQHSLSLNLKARREERARQEKERLDRENSRRAAKNLPAFKSIEEIDKDKATLPDVVLSQAAEIMADMVAGVRATPAGQPQKTARRG
jgi:carboxyl-terminal processing protease